MRPGADHTTKGEVMVRPPVDRESVGILGFVVAMLVLSGLVKLLLGLTELLRSAALAGSPVVGDRWAAGIVALVLAGLYFYVAYGITQHRESARVMGIVLAIIGLLDHLVADNVATTWVLLGGAIDLIIIYALCVHGERFYKTTDTDDVGAMG